MKEPEKQTTKKCPKCGNIHLLLFPSLNYKICTDCNTKISWYLDPGQQRYY